ncbi:DUF192 domain-containing protein [Cellulomonas timonensis]|uniref:DUF192 domain-containing protein n=1 Tax=Cellulomonas timonensis TaxID=1689271 RepID=UPI00082CAC0F|nr:DUF192 domain-containing protein [Cellulomonas timonensis]
MTNPVVPLSLDGRVVAQGELADTWARRLRGLLGRRALPDALVLRPESSVHGIGMRAPLDVAVLAADGTVLVTRVLRPWRATLPVRGGHAVLEAPVGSFARWGLRLGSKVTLGAPAERAAPQE